MGAKRGQSLLMLTMALIILAGCSVRKTEKRTEPMKSNEIKPTATPKGYETNPEAHFEVPIIEVEYVNGKPHGKTIERYQNGARVEVNTIMDGKPGFG